MTYKILFVALSVIAAGSQLSAAQTQSTREAGAPPAAADARYCLRVDPTIGSRIETIRCETREGWAQLGVDVDQEWASWGIRVIGRQSLST